MGVNVAKWGTNMNYNESYVKKLLPKRPLDSHKGTFGHVLNIAGSGFYTGAAYFSSLAPLKVGCGRSTLASVQNVLMAVSSLTPDVILMPLEETKEKTISANAIKKLEKNLDNYDVISIGCGLSLNEETEVFVEELIDVLKKTEIPVIIDADGLNIIASQKMIHLPLNTTLTPHPMEMARLMGVNVDQIFLQSDFWAKKCADKYNATVVLKTHKTIVADIKGNFYQNNTGNTALSHGGSGDVLCGMIAGLISQGLNSFDASILAVYLHGKTAEIASEDLTEYSTLASDLLKYIPSAIKTML